MFNKYGGRGLDLSWYQYFLAKNSGLLEAAARLTELTSRYDYNLLKVTVPLAVTPSLAGLDSNVLRDISAAASYYEQHRFLIERVSSILKQQSVFNGAALEGVFYQYEHIRNTLELISWDNLGSLVGLSYRTKRLIDSTFSKFAISYADVTEKSTNSTVFPEDIFDLSTVEFSNSVNFLGEISIESGSNEVTVESSRNEIIEQTADSLQELLSKLDRDLINMWSGAKQVLMSDNPDRVRHYLASMRELLTHVLHNLAPDTEVRAWTNLPEHFHDGKPTRKARMLYICRTINFEPFDSFLEKDIDAVLALFSLFNRMHQITINLTNSQLETMSIRIESALRMLLTTAQTVNLL